MVLLIVHSASSPSYVSFVPECLYAGVFITVVGMGEKDELLYGMYPGNYVMALGDYVI
jgi:hypothetical protein